MSFSRYVLLPKCDGFKLCRTFSQQSSHREVVFDYLQGRHEGVAVIGKDKKTKHSIYCRY